MRTCVIAKSPSWTVVVGVVLALAACKRGEGEHSQTEPARSASVQGEHRAAAAVQRSETEGGGSVAPTPPAQRASAPAQQAKGGERGAAIPRPASTAAAGKVAQPSQDAGVAAKLIGTWAIDPSGFEDLDEIKNLPEDQRQAALRMFQDMAAKMSVTITANTLVMAMGDRKEEVRYEVKKVEGNVVTIEGTGQDGKTDTVDMTIEGDRLIMSKKGEKMKLVLRRKS